MSAPRPPGSTKQSLTPRQAAALELVKLGHRTPAKLARAMPCSLDRAVLLLSALETKGAIPIDLRRSNP